MASARPLTEAEQSFLRHPPRALARIATVDEAGLPHVVPSGWYFDEDAHELALGGRDVPATARARQVRQTGVAAVVIDGVDTSNGWVPWAILVRGAARVDEQAGEIRVTLDHVTSWGLENARGTSAAAS